MTLTLVAVYAPMAFATGRTGKLFIEFALTLAGAVLVSGFVALTLTPMMCAKLLREHEEHGRLYNLLERFFQGHDERLPPGARGGFVHAVPGRCPRARGCRGQLLLLHAAQVGTRPRRGSRLDYGNRRGT
jgi:hypothetical protein